jgi:2-polyprenyl-6-methoxyphenol hydroxylase-like FAD-dependent oxidoreductase
MIAKRVLVIGAGPTGASLAFLLARRVIGVCLIEREASLDRVFRGEGMMVGGMEALAQMGILAEVERLPQRRLDRWRFSIRPSMSRWDARCPAYGMNAPTTHPLGDGRRPFGKPPGLPA